MKHFSLLMVIFMSILSGCANTPATPLRTVQYVDLERYMGDWYVIANIPYFAERNCFDSLESYALRDDGRIDNWFSCRRGAADAPFERKASAVAKVADTETNSRWSVRFFGFISVKYLVLDLDQQYQWAVVGHPSRNYGWILARDKELPQRIYDGILKRLGEQGYDLTRFEKVPQS